MSERKNQQISDFAYGFCPDQHERRLVKFHAGLAAMKFAHKHEFKLVPEPQYYIDQVEKSISRGLHEL